MKLTNNIEVNGLTDIVINRKTHWKISPCNGLWSLIIADKALNPKTSSQISHLIRGYINNRKYRCWLSPGSDTSLTLNIVRKQPTPPSASRIAEAIKVLKIIGGGRP